jgi:hypothetical protein
VTVIKQDRMDRLASNERMSVQVVESYASGGSAGCCVVGSACQKLQPGHTNIIIQTSSQNIARHDEEPLMKETYALLAKSMNGLSVEERNGALDDLHGVSSTQGETPELRRERMKDMEAHIQQMDPTEKRAYSLAYQDSANYVTSERFTMRFLRTENLDPKRAAERLIRYFEHKLELFGREKLVKDLSVDDLSEEDLKYIATGFCNVLDKRDRSGRVVFYTDSSISVKVPITVRARVQFYLYSLMSRDETVQKLGAVIVISAVGQRTYFQDRAIRMAALLSSVPVKIVALHACYDDPILHPVIRAGAYALERRLIVRLRLHFGSTLECKYQLLQYGIQSSIFPDFITDDPSTSKINVEVEWVRPKLELERKIPPAERIVAPTSKDVLFGRGKVVFRHPGNVNYRHLLQKLKERYHGASKFEKTVLVGTILIDIRDIGGRFLLHGKDGWIEAPDETSRKKISHDFRNHRQSAEAVEAFDQSSPHSTSKRPIDHHSSLSSIHDGFDTDGETSTLISAGAKRFKK